MLEALLPNEKIPPPLLYFIILNYIEIRQKYIDSKGTNKASNHRRCNHLYRKQLKMLESLR